MESKTIIEQATNISNQNQSESSQDFPLNNMFSESSQDRSFYQRALKKIAEPSFTDECFQYLKDTVRYTSQKCIMLYHKINDYLTLYEIKVSLAPGAVIPKFEHLEDAGADFYALENYTIAPHDQMMCDTGVTMELPRSMWLQLLPKSGLAVKKRVRVEAGVIDENYRERVKAIIYNNSDVPLVFLKGEKMCQGVLRKRYRTRYVHVESLSVTDRKGGFGSTGK